MIYFFRLLLHLVYHYRVLCLPPGVPSLPRDHGWQRLVGRGWLPDGRGIRPGPLGWHHRARHAPGTPSRWLQGGRSLADYGSI